MNSHCKTALILFFWAVAAKKNDQFGEKSIFLVCHAMSRSVTLCHADRPLGAQIGAKNHKILIFPKLFFGHQNKVAG